MDDCKLCKDTALEVGEQSSYGSITVYKTGSNPEADVSVVLQPTTYGHGSFIFMLMPVGHYDSPASLPDAVGPNWGSAQIKLSRAIDEVIEDNHGFIYGKWNTPENTQAHLHVKMGPYMGTIAQAWATDTSWAKRRLIHSVSGPYITALPVEKSKHEPSDLETIASQIILGMQK